MRPGGRFGAHEGGATAVLAALTAPLLLAMAGLAAEGGMAYFKHAKMQSVSDAAAFSAGAAFRAGAGVPGAKLEATAIAASLGYRSSEDGGPVTVTVNSPPATGPNRANPMATEVILTFDQAPLLTKVFRTDPYRIRSRSVSILNAQTDPACVVALDPSGAGALHLGGGPTVNAQNCDVVVNSGNPSALTGNGNGGLSAVRLDIVGGVDLRGNVSIPPQRNITVPLADPYADLPVPAIGGCNQSSPPTQTNPVPAGVYCGGLSLKNGAFRLSGVYVVIGGDFDVGANAKVTGAGVTIITIPDGPRAPSRVQIAANASFQISAPTSGPYAGVAVFATGGTAASPDQVKWNGTSNIDVAGAIYMPHTNLTLSGDVASKGASCTQILAWRVAFQGNATISSSCAATGTRTFGVNSGSGTVSLSD